MKIQELAIIFIIIILPISLLISEYTQFQIQTINTQSLYDAKLTASTYDAIKTFQINAANSTTSDISNSKRRDLEASIASFRNSIKTAFELNGYTEEELNNYIPALVYTLYDGFYIYSPYENTEQGDESIYGLKPYINYSCRYKTSNVDVVITYTLDNFVTVQGMVDGKYVNESGYLIDGIEIDGINVKYNGVNIQTEQLQEKILGQTFKYAKVNGTKYYLIESEQKIVYFLNGKLMKQCSVGDPQYTALRGIILNNDSARQYYIEAYEFTEWFKSTYLKDLKYEHAIDEVINENGETSITRIWPTDTRKIFDFNPTTSNINENIENELSNFNQHRLGIIRHKIETNLAIAIANYNSYSVSDNVFQMPKLKETEWENIVHNISVISFLQGLPIGGKVYNGYSIVNNTESEEVVLEDNIYILGRDTANNKYNYYKVGDKGFQDSSIEVNSKYYGNTTSESAGRLNLDFEVQLATDNNSVLKYYYPLEDYDASYDSVVMQNNVNTYDDVYEYINTQSNDLLREAFYTALGRERYGMYRSSNYSNIENNVLVVGTVGNSSHEQLFMKQLQEISEELRKISSIKVAYIYSLDDAYLTNYINMHKDKYNLIIITGFAWQLGLNNSTITSIANSTNVITISNDATGLPMIASSITSSSTVEPQITELGKGKLGDIPLNRSSDSSQATITFMPGVDVLYKGRYSGGVTGEYDLIGHWKNGNYNWIHSQYWFSYDKTDHMQLLKELVRQALK